MPPSTGAFRSWRPRRNPLRRRATDRSDQNTDNLRLTVAPSGRRFEESPGSGSERRRRDSRRRVPTTTHRGAAGRPFGAAATCGEENAGRISSNATCGGANACCSRTNARCSLAAASRSRAPARRILSPAGCSRAAACRVGAAVRRIDGIAQAAEGIGIPRRWDPRSRLPAELGPARTQDTASGQPRRNGWHFSGAPAFEDDDRHGPPVS